MHQHVEWDEPGNASVARYFKNDPDHTPPYPGAILSARYQGRIVRVKVDAYREEDAVSIGSVAAILDQHGHRFKAHQKLNVGDIVRLPVDKRAMERWVEDDEEEKE